MTLSLHHFYYYPFDIDLLQQISKSDYNKTTPVIVKMFNFTNKKASTETWISKPFFVFEGGYKMCLRVDAAGYGDGEGTHVSVYLYLMKGPHDDRLEQSGHWPLRGTFTIELLNQYTNHDHYTRLMVLSGYLCTKCINRVVDSNMSTGMGFDQFISHNVVPDYVNHLLDDALHFNITYEDDNNSLPNYQTAPLIMNMTKFAERKRNREQWYSSPFFAFDGGYLICVQIYAAGYGDGEGTHVSVFLHLMKGPHDDKLEQSGHWPLRGTFTIELLNQLNDGDHYSCKIVMYGCLCSQCSKRDVEDYMSNVEYGYHQFVSHNKIFYNKPKEYLKNNVLFFRIKYENISIASNQGSPVIPVMPAFTEKMKNKEIWYSNPFFVFKKGYKMCLRVDAAGYGAGKGTHVSVYLQLMKGQHDDKLEKSGHYPLRGKFTIELLNQFTNHDHYTRSMLLSGYLCSECINRVIDGNLTTGVGFDQFISHDIIPDYVNHLFNDALYFNITYEDDNSSLPNYQTAPLVMNMTKFAERKRNREQWYSSPFFAFDGGYLICVQIYAAGHGDGEGTHVSVFLHLMKGPHDDKLEQSGYWPLRGTFTIEVLNQLSSHKSYISTHDYLRSQCTEREVEDYMNSVCFGYHHFIPHYVIFYKRAYKYLDLTFIINYEEITSPMSNDRVAPVTFVVPNFTEKMKNKVQWYSSPFFAFQEGYQMCLRVVTKGYFSDEDTTVQVLLYLMKGPHDDKLEKLGHWPLEGILTIELLNQINDGDHFVYTISLYHYLCNKCTNRVLEGDIAPKGWGSKYYISRNAILNQNSKQYFINDALHFRISYEKYPSPLMPDDKVVPVAFKLCNVTSKIKKNEMWFSVPFFAFEEGYKVSLVLRMNGYKTGKGTHVSFYVRPMKGPHDDKLEQSGHWPMRGTFTIEILNQLNDSDHYSQEAKMDNNKCSHCTKRVLRNNIAPTGWGSHRFISHKAIFQDDKYLKDDCTNFRVSYKDTGYSTSQVHITPVKLRMNNVNEIIKNNDRWYSEPFFAFKEGYKLHLKVYGSGYGDGEGTHLSVFLCLMKGPYDDTLDWPMSGTFLIELLNQSYSNGNYIRTVVVYGYLYGICTDRVSQADLSDTAPECCHFKFAPHEILYSKSKPVYLKNNTLLFRISYERNPPISYGVAPVILNISNFTNRLKRREHWISSPFYAFEGGYQMCVSIDFAGDNHSNDQNTYISIFVHPLNGSFDNELQDSSQWFVIREVLLIEMIHFHGNEYVQKGMYILSNETCESCITVIDTAEKIRYNYMIPSRHVDGGLKNNEIFLKISYNHYYTCVFVRNWVLEDLVVFIILYLLDGLSTFVMLVAIKVCESLIGISKALFSIEYAKIERKHAASDLLFILSIVICKAFAFMLWEFANIINYSSAVLMSDMLDRTLIVFLYLQIVNFQTLPTIYLIVSPVWMVYIFSQKYKILFIITSVVTINIFQPFFKAIYFTCCFIRTTFDLVYNNCCIHT